MSTYPPVIILLYSVNYNDYHYLVARFLVALKRRPFNLAACHVLVSCRRRERTWLPCNRVLFLAAGSILLIGDEAGIWAVLVAAWLAETVDSACGSTRTGACPAALALTNACSATGFAAPRSPL